MTILEAIAYGEKQLLKAGIESARIDSEWLLAYVLEKQKRSDLFLNQTVLSDSDRGKFTELIKRRLGHYPLQYIVGEAPFFEDMYLVNENVLIPRPETEVLVDRVYSYLKERQSPTILDIGTGSGCIAVSIARRCVNSKVYALDISQKALELARKNAERLNVKERITFYESDLYDKLPANVRFDCILTNLPYISEKEMSLLPEEVRYEPYTALAGGEDGLVFYRRLFREAEPYIGHQTLLACEFGCKQKDALIALAQKYEWEVLETFIDLNGLDRGMIASKH